MSKWRKMVSVVGLSFAAAFAGSGYVAEAAAESDVREAESALSRMMMERAVFQSGWPGTRGYAWLVGDGRPILPESVEVFDFAIYGAGAQSVAWRFVGNQIEVSVTMHEGEMFNPAQHHAEVVVVFRYL